MFSVCFDKFQAGSCCVDFVSRLQALAIKMNALQMDLHAAVDILNSERIYTDIIMVIICSCILL